MRYDKELETLQLFRQWLEELLNEKRHSTDETRNLRKNINQKIPLVVELFRKVGEPTTIYYSPPPIVGGLAGSVCLFNNLFLLNKMQISYSRVFDSLDRAIGRYQHRQSLWRQQRFSPLFWAGELIRLPFRLIRFAGFDSNKAEQSLVGRLYKFIMGAVATLTAFISVLLKLLVWIQANWAQLEPWLKQTFGWP